MNSPFSLPDLADQRVFFSYPFQGPLGLIHISLPDNQDYSQTVIKGPVHLRLGIPPNLRINSKTGGTGQLRR